MGILDLGDDTQMQGSNLVSNNFTPGVMEFGGSAPLAGNNLKSDNFGGGNQWSDFMKLLLGGKNEDGTSQNGLGGFGLDAIGGIANTYLGMKQYGLAKDSLDQRRSEFNKNFETQKRLTNSQMRDRQKARLAASPNAGFQSVSDYMQQNGVQ